MSKFMQIDIRIIPFFEKPFEKTFPNIAKLLRRLSYEEILKKGISFYDLIDTMVTIMEHPDTPKEIKETIAPVVRKMDDLKETAREYLLARKLNDLDQVFYQIEDQFEDLERFL